MNFFSSKKQQQPPQQQQQQQRQSAPQINYVVPTGGKIDEVVKALVESASDGEKFVSAKIFNSLLDISKTHPELVISTSIAFIREGKPRREHVILLLNLLIQMLEKELENISEQLAIHTIQTALSEMLKDPKEVIPEWQGPAANILTIISKRFPRPIWSALTEQFAPGKIPPYFVIKCFGDVAAANPMSIVPSLKEIMARSIPVLGQIKKDNLRWVFSAAFGLWSEAIITYTANKESAPDPSISPESFSSEVFPTFEIFFNSWLKSNESKVRLTALLAIGKMSAIMPRDQLEANLFRIIPTYIGMYKKEKDHLPISRGLSTILEVSTSNESIVLEPHVNPILAVLHPVFCTHAHPAAEETPLLIKNVNELLRCFTALTARFPDIVLPFLLVRIDITKVKAPEIRFGTLQIIRHLITHLNQRLADRRELILSGIRPLTESETVLEVKKVLCQTIIALSTNDYLVLEGGNRMIEFILKQSAVSDRECEAYEAALKKKKAVIKEDDITPAKLRTMCDNILHLSTTSVPSMETVLWPYLLEFLPSPLHTYSLHSICRSLSYIATQKRENNASDYMLDFDRLVNLPKPPQIIARLFVMLNEPQRRGQLGLRILECLQALGPILCPTVSSMWDSAMPRMASYIESNSGTESWDTTTWEDLTLRLLSETLRIVNDEEWTQILGEQFAAQLDYYRPYPFLKKCAVKLLGLVLQRLNRREFVRSKLDQIFHSLDHKSDVERQGCAEAFGYCSATHVDLVLDKLKVYCEQVNQEKKKSAGLFSSSSSSSPLAFAENTIFLTLGYISTYAPSNLVISRLDSHIIHMLEPYMLSKNSSFERKESIIKTIDLIAKALHPSRLQEEYQFRRRDELINVIVSYMTSSKDVPVSLRVAGFNTCSTLLHLQPPMPYELEGNLISSTMRSFMELPLQGNERMIEDLNTNFNDMLTAMLSKDQSSICFDRIFDIISVFLRSPHPQQRSRVISSILHLLKKFLEFKSFEDSAETNIEESFASLGSIVGILVPRLADPDSRIRMSSLECIELLFICDHMLRSSYGKEKYDLSHPEELNTASELRGQLEEANIHEQYSIIHQLSVMVSKLLTKQQLSAFLVHAAKGLLDPNASSSGGTCVMLNGIIKSRGEELSDEIEPLVNGLLTAMESIRDEKTMSGTLHSLRGIAVHHLLPVAELLLQTPIPHHPNVVKTVQIIARDSTLVVPLIDHLTDILNHSQVTETVSVGGKPSLEHTNRAMAATIMMGEILDVDDLPASFISEHYVQILCTLLLRFGTSRWGRTIAAEQTLSSFKSFIAASKADDIKRKLNKKGRWQKLATNDQYHFVITSITHVVCQSSPQHVHPIYEFILPFLQANFTGQRIIAATVLAELIRHVRDSSLLQNLINNMLSIMSDDVLRLMCLRGLGNVSYVGKDEVNKFGTTIIDALMCSIDSPDEITAMEAMNGLSKIFELIDENLVAPILVNICHRIRPAFEKQQEIIRAASFQLFGSLHRFGNDPSGAVVFYEQIHTNLPSLMLHINDVSENVRKNCKRSLKKFGNLLKVPAILEYLNETLRENNNNFHLEDFLNKFSSLLVQYFPERINFYVMTCTEFFNSNWIELRCAAAMFVGHALHNVPLDKRNNISLNPSLISSAMISLLKQKSPEVRAAGADALSYFTEY